MAQSKQSIKHRRKKRGMQSVLMIGAGTLLLALAVVAVLSGLDGSEDDGISIPLLDGTSVSLSDFAGQTVVLNFWATWCPPCRAEMPLLDAYYREYREDGLVMIAINSGETAVAAAGFFQQNGFAIPVGLDPDGHLGNQFGVTGLPVTLVINPQGEIHYRHAGMIDRSILDGQITPLLSGG
nr:TlpA family protein disulfide reductase [Anaerolineae bacterium]